MQNIGERLEEARKRRGISLREAAEATKIRADFLQNFENNQFEIGVPDLYIRGFLRNYSVYLKISPDKIVSDYQASVGGGPVGFGRDKARELFGRIELAAASEEGTGPVVPLGPGAPSAGAPVPPSTQMRGETDNRVKLGLIAGSAIIVVALIISLVRLLISSSSEDAGQASGASTDNPVQPRVEAPVATPSGASEIFLIAKDNVDVQVISRGDGSTIYKGTLRRGARQALQISGQVRIVTATGSNLEVESGGKRWSMPYEGYSNAVFPPP